MGYEFDIVVAGGGIAGVSAALSATRMGKKVAIIEKSSVLGGLATLGLIHWYEPLCDGRGKQIIYSQAEELLRLSIKYGYKTLDESWLTNKTGKNRYSTWFDPNLFALSLVKLLSDNNVTMFFESTISEVIVEGNQVKAIEFYTVEGKNIIFAKAFVDATGSAYVIKKSGLPVRKGENYLTYATSFYRENNDRVFQYTGAGCNGENQLEGSRHYVGDNNKDVSDYIITGSIACLKEFEENKIKKIEQIPGMPQFRKINCLVGEYTLTKDDLGKHFEDSIGAIAAFDKPGNLYEIPFRCLYNKRITNLFAAGRIVSSDNEGWEVTRVIPVCALTGEVAGIAAALVLDSKIDSIFNVIAQKGINIHF